MARWSASSRDTFNRSCQPTAPAASRWLSGSRAGRRSSIMAGPIMPPTAHHHRYPVQPGFAAQSVRGHAAGASRRATASSGSTTRSPNTSPSCRKAATSGASRSASSRPTRRGCCCRRTTHPGRIGATRCRSSSERSTPGRRTRSPVKQHLYTHAGFILLQLALERRFGLPIDELMEQRLLRPLGMASTTLPRRDDSPRGRLSPEHSSAARCRATPTTASRSASPAISRAITTGRARARCTRPRATWRSFSPPISASCRSTGRCRRRWQAGAARRRDHRPAQPAGAGLGGHRRQRADHRGEVRRSRQRIGLYRDDAEPASSAS